LDFERYPISALNVGMAELLGAFEQAVLLTIVKLAEGAYGRSILRDVQIRVNRDVAAGAIYATLDRLEQKALLSSRLDAGTPVRGGRPRRFYSITADGIGALNEARAASDRMWRGTKWPLEVKA
jgi:DNA-binding PadR family transcriptional regulator